MRLDDINAFLDVKVAYDRMARRAGIPFDESVYLPTMGEFREAATVTDSSIKREAHHDGVGATFKFYYRGVEFWYMGKSGEVA